MDTVKKPCFLNMVYRKFAFEDMASKLNGPAVSQDPLTLAHGTVTCIKPHLSRDMSESPIIHSTSSAASFTPAVGAPRA